MKTAHILLLALTLAAAAPAADRRTSFNAGWRFFKGEAAGAEQPAFDDSGWRQLELPHDWAIEGPFDPKYNPHCGGLPFYGTGWYRKHFSLPASLKGKLVSIEFDGAMSNSTVWLNGKELGGRPYGYSSFALDLTPALNAGGENVLAVRLTPEDASSRWYPGAGIYRNVWLVATGPVRVEHWGTYVTTPDVSDNSATVAIRTQVENRGTQGASIIVETHILDAAGKPVGRTGTNQRIEAAGAATLNQSLTVARPQRWDIDHPYLYKAVTRVLEGRKELDRYETPFGIRTIQFDAKKGFFLNGRYLKMQGVCNHHDLGALGAAVNRRATERQLQIMKSMGVNALRTSHNPPSPEILEYCDRLGILVMDEAFDMWHIPKVKNGYAKYFDQWGDTDLRDMLRRDRNHPSIVLWSIGNEIPEQGRPEGAKIAKRLTDICHEEDRTRPVTSAFNNDVAAIKNGLADVVDVVGLNYKPQRYTEIMPAHPAWVVVGTETASTVSSRGVYHLPLERYDRSPDLQVTSYDIIAPPWATVPDVEFNAQDKLPGVLGEFVWTGFDYLGEPTPYGRKDDWPSRSSYFGIVDLAGFPKDRFYLYKSQWSKEPVLHILPHWNWAGREGQMIPVLAYTNLDEVELFLNGKSLGRKKRGSEPFTIPLRQNRTFESRYRLPWQVAYEPGTLKAIGYKDGKALLTDEVHTAGPAAQIKLTPDRARIAADGEDLSFMTVRIEDKDGNLCPLADNLVRFKLDGNARIAGVDNGNAATVEPFHADYRKAFNGLALLIVRSERGRPGRVRVTATSEGLRAAETTIEAR